MKRWLPIAAAVILLSPLVLATDDAPARRDAPRERDEMRRPDTDSPEFPVMMERFGNMLREHQERLDRIETQQHHIMKEIQSRLALDPDRAVRPDHKQKDKGFLCVLLLGCMVVHVLVAVWVFQDIRTRGTGSGLWIVIALLSGLVGALVYAVVRLGDLKKA